MNSRLLSLSILLMLVLIGGNACRKKTDVAQSPAPGATANAASPEQYQHDNAALAIPQTKFFKGSIGARLGLQMKLTRDGEKVMGNYSYQRVGARIDLKGTIDKDGNLTLEEFDAGGKQTGLFKGNWLADKDDGLISVVGNWSKPGGEKKTAFSLHEEPIEFSGGVELTAKQIKETNKKVNYQIDAAYPQVTGVPDSRFDKFNQEAKNLVMKRISGFKKETTEVAKDETAAATPDASPENKSSSPANTLDISYSIALAKDDLISIEFDVGNYASGAAHANYDSEVLNYDLKAGKVLKMADLFSPGAKYIQSISAYCIKDLKNQSKSPGSLLDDQTIQSGAGPNAGNYDSWTITKKGLKITFDPYQVAAFAAGQQSVVVPYSALKELIKPDGPLAQFAK
jgi:hypothetical protein